MLDAAANAELSSSVLFGGGVVLVFVGLLLVLALALVFALALGVLVAAIAAGFGASLNNPSIALAIVGVALRA